ncbi:TM2 domain-containing protein [Deinococcus hohokamensis]|uniref:TM2 domain-containing protein n=1 Tax=Deinococcus hohokamensis TaxID=309883 RepID=A0ABV9IA53_9DEIO
MTKPDNDRDAPRDPTPQGLTPPGNAPSWVDDVLQASRAAPAAQLAEAANPGPVLSGPDDLRLPGDQPAAPGGLPPRASLTPPAAPRPAPPAEPFDADDWIARATGGSARSPRVPSGSAQTVTAQPTFDEPRGQPDPWTTPLSQPGTAPLAPYRPVTSSDIAQKKLIAGLLGIFLGWLGVHKFYLGMTGPGLTMLGVQLGVWVLALVLGVLLLFVGLFVTIPLAGLVSSAVGLLGLIEGILYLTKSDADFERDYLIGKKPWF